jgi:hypothetical protein
MLRRPDGSGMSMHPLQSVVVLGAPIDDAVLILTLKKIKNNDTTYTQKLSNMVATLAKARFDILGNGDTSREFNLGSSCSKQLTQRSVSDDIARPVVFRDPLDEMHTKEQSVNTSKQERYVIPDFHVSVRSIRMEHGHLALVRKQMKDGPAGSIGIGTFCTIAHCLFSKAPECMMSKICS